MVFYNKTQFTLISSFRQDTNNNMCNINPGFVWSPQDYILKYSLAKTIRSRNDHDCLVMQKTDKPRKIIFEI